MSGFLLFKQPHTHSHTHTRVRLCLPFTLFIFYIYIYLLYVVRFNCNFENSLAVIELKFQHSTKVKNCPYKHLSKYILYKHINAMQIYIK